MDERMDDLQDFVRQLSECIPPKSSFQRKNVIDRIRKAKEVTEDIKELVNSATEENISKLFLLALVSSLTHLLSARCLTKKKYVFLILDLVLSSLIDQSFNLPSFIKSAEHMNNEYKDSFNNIMEIFEMLLTRYQSYTINYLTNIKVNFV